MGLAGFNRARREAKAKAKAVEALATPKEFTVVESVKKTIDKTVKKTRKSLVED